MTFQPTPEQEAVLAHRPRQHARLLAGPGTGKSATVVALINRVLEEEEPPRIRLLTFTRAATGELAEKVADHPASATLRPSTIHSFAISVLLRNPGAGEFPEPLRIADDWEYKAVVLPTLRDRTGVHISELKKLFGELAANWERLEPHLNASVTQASRRAFLGAWREHREVFGYTLLSELPNALREALLRHPDLNGLDYGLLVVDEYQDLNACDLELLRIISDRGVSVIGCGDDNQSIYSFRHASPAGIRRFPEDYPGCSDYALSITHRCGSRILDWALHVIEGAVDVNRAALGLTPAPGSPEGEVALLRFGGQRLEARGVAKLVRNLVEVEGLAPNRILILMRSDHQGRFSTPIQQALTAAGIAYSDPTAVMQLFNEESNRRLIAQLRLLVEPRDSLAWATLLTLQRGISTRFIQSLYEIARQRRVTFAEALQLVCDAAVPAEPEMSARRARALVEETRGIFQQVPVPNEVPDNGWGHWIADITAATDLSTPSGRLIDLLSKIDDLAEADVLGRFLGQMFPLAKDIAQTEAEGVRIMNMASSKGLTVDATILVGAEEGLVPHPKGELEEERRLLYVAMTRSKRFLYLTWAGQRTGPTARAGRGRVGRQNHSTFLNGGPVRTQDGEGFVRNRWP